MGAVQELKRIHELIRLGKSDESLRLVTRLSRSQSLTPAQRLELAELAIQARGSTITLRLLLPEYRRWLKTRGASERAMHPRAQLAFVLASVESGSTQAALQMLATIPSDAHDPRTLDAWIVAHSRTWAWDETPPLQRQILADPRSAPADRLIAEIGLAVTAILGSKPDPRGAEARLREIETLAEEVARPALHREWLLARIDAVVHVGEPKPARALLTEARRLYPAETDRLFAAVLDRSEAALDAFSGDDVPGGLRRLVELRDVFLSQGYWERARKCDYYAAYSGRSWDALLRIAFGSSYAPLRARCATLARERYARELPAAAYRGPTAGTVLEVPLGDEVDLATPGLEPHTVPGRALQALLSEIYRPVPVPDLHAAILGDQVFDPASSPARVRQTVARLRKLLKHAAPLWEIVQSSGGYRLQATSPRAPALRTSFMPPPLPKDARREELRARFGDATFTLREAARALGQENKTTLRLLNSWLADGQVERTGATRSLRYRLNQRS